MSWCGAEAAEGAHRSIFLLFARCDGPGRSAWTWARPKNDDGREVYLTEELRGLLAAQLARVKVLGERLERVIPYVFRTWA